MSKYDFPGIQKLGTAGLKLALLSSPLTAWLAKIPAITDFLLDHFVNWAANRGLIILNVGAIYLNGTLDQAALDTAIDEGLKRIAAGNVTPEEGKAIDDKVIAAADHALPYNKPN